MEKGIIKYDPVEFNSYYESLQQDKDKRVLQAAIKAWNRAGNNIKFSTFYNVVMPDHDKNIAEKDVRSMPMRLFNSINSARMHSLANIVNIKKDAVAPSIDKAISSYIKSVRNRKRIYDLKKKTLKIRRIESS